MALSRRQFLEGSVAVLGAGAALKFGRSGNTDARNGEAVDDIHPLDLEVMLSVTNASKGELEILVGERAIPFTDMSLVAELARVASAEVT